MFIYAYIAIFTVILIYSFFIWNLKGRDSFKGKEIATPSKNPPKGISFGQMLFLDSLNFSKDTRFAILLDLVNKGYLSIQEKDEVLFLKLENSNQSYENIKKEDKLFLDVLFSEKKSKNVVLSRKDANKFRKAFKAYTKEVENSLVGKYINKNGEYLVFNYISIGTVGFLILFDLVYTKGVNILFIIIPFVLIFILWQFLREIIDTLKDVAMLKERLNRVFYILLLSIGLLFISIILFLIGAMIGINLVVIFAFSFSLIITLYFRHYIISRTEEGIEMTCKIDSFKMYVRTTERGRFDVLARTHKATDKDLRHLLPYAVAFGVDFDWDRFFKTEDVEKYWYKLVPHTKEYENKVILEDLMLTWFD